MVNIFDDLQDTVISLGFNTNIIGYNGFSFSKPFAVNHQGVHSFNDLSNPLQDVERFNTFCLNIGIDFLATELQLIRDNILNTNNGVLPDGPNYTVAEALTPNCTYWSIHNPSSIQDWKPCRVHSEPLIKTFHYSITLVEDGI